MRGFFSKSQKYTLDAIEFNNFLETNKDNTDHLLNLELLSNYREVHPREEHFMPFFVIL